MRTRKTQRSQNQKNLWVAGRSLLCEVKRRLPGSNNQLVSEPKINISDEKIHG